MGWLNLGNFLTVSRRSAQTYTFQIRPIESSSNGLLCLRIPIPRNRIPMQFGWGADPNTVDLFYYLEYRRPSGTFEPFASTDPVVNGVSIRLGTDIDTNFMTQLVDSHPDTPTYNDAPLAVGETFSDSVSGVTVRTLSTTATDATVEVAVTALNLPADLLWFRHDGWQDGGSTWAGSSGTRVGTSWQTFQSVFASGDGLIYGILPNGDLRWYSNDGWQNGTASWAAFSGSVAAQGWQSYRSVFATSEGVIYAIQSNGDLLWFKHQGMPFGLSVWAPGSGARVGTGWQNFQSVFATSDGVIYGIQPNGDLRWYKHNGWRDGVSSWDSASGAKVGQGWQNFRSAFATSDGVIYGIQSSGDLLWYKHTGWQTGAFTWAAGSGTRVGQGWQNFRSIFATSNGVLYGIEQ
ncbi:MAG TPA: tachylectin-related carbohydrate-binding protein [Blastocatellia bacterium]|nr:tachylectin-related carbohydrate-binding protein [Blastocatellia bacterium]